MEIQYVPADYARSLIDHLQEQIDAVPASKKFQAPRHRGEQYRQYLKTPAWKHKRRIKIIECAGVCESCHKQPATQVHHISYENVPNEKMADLQALCQPCHWEAHGVDVV